MPNPRRVSILLFDGFSNLCLANAVEPLRAANMLARKTLYQWRFVGISGAQVVSSSGLPVQPDRLGTDSRGDYLFVMPSYGHRALATVETARRLRAAAPRFKTLVGLDTGAWLLADAGLLQGHRATSHWDILADLAEAFPEVDVVEDRVVHDGARISCGGASTTIELMFELIEAHHGASLALEVAALFMHGERAPHHDPIRRLPPHKVIHAAAAVMRRHVETPLPIAEIAKAVGLRQRALEQVFAHHAQQTPQRTYRAIRLAEARRRLEHERQSVAEIALRSGYRNATAMTRAFKAEFGVTPRAVRAATRTQGTTP